MKEQITALSKNSSGWPTSVYQLEIGLNSSCLGRRDNNWVWLFPVQDLSQVVKVKHRHSDKSPEQFAWVSIWLFCKMSSLVLSRGQMKARPAHRAAPAITETLGARPGQQGNWKAVYTQVALFTIGPSGPSTEIWAVFAKALKSAVLTTVGIILFMCRTGTSRQCKKGHLSSSRACRQCLSVLASRVRETSSLIFQHRHSLGSYVSEVLRAGWEGR